MADRARFMAGQPGFSSPSACTVARRIVNYVQWSRREELQAAHKSPQFRKECERFDRLTEGIDPHLYEVCQIMDGGR